MDLILASNMRKKDSKMAIVIHELEFACRTVSLSLPSLPPLQFSPLKVRVSSGILSAMKRHQGGNHLAELATGPSICPPCICSRQRLHHVHYGTQDRVSV
ncbi:Chaperone protein HscA [Trichinella pseudospiralis]